MPSGRRLPAPPGRLPGHRHHPRGGERARAARAPLHRARARPARRTRHVLGRLQQRALRRRVHPAHAVPEPARPVRPRVEGRRLALGSARRRAPDPGAAPRRHPLADDRGRASEQPPRAPERGQRSRGRAGPRRPRRRARDDRPRPPRPRASASPVRPRPRPPRQARPRPAARTGRAAVGARAAGARRGGHSGRASPPRARRAAGAPPDEPERGHRARPRHRSVRPRRARRGRHRRAPVHARRDRARRGRPRRHPPAPRSARGRREQVPGARAVPRAPRRRRRTARHRSHAPSSLTATRWRDLLDTSGGERPFDAIRAAFVRDDDAVARRTSTRACTPAASSRVAIAPGSSGVRAADPGALRALGGRFDDPRLDEMLFRYRARNYPDSLDADERTRWRAARHAPARCDGRRPVAESRGVRAGDGRAAVAGRRGVPSRRHWNVTP